MQEQIHESLQRVIQNWDKMKGSQNENAEEDANWFEASFYELMEKVRGWLQHLKKKPGNLDEALEMPEIVELLELLPPMLHLNFETELEFILEGISRIEDDKYD